jgi:hypothetical protein
LLKVISLSPGSKILYQDAGEKKSIKSIINDQKMPETSSNSRLSKPNSGQITHENESHVTAEVRNTYTNTGDNESPKTVEIRTPDETILLNEFGPFPSTKHVNVNTIKKRQPSIPTITQTIVSNESSVELPRTFRGKNRIKMSHGDWVDSWEKRFTKSVGKRDGPVRAIPNGHSLVMYSPA